MGHIRERNLKDGGIRYQAEIRLKGHPILTASFDRKTDAKNWIQKVEADIRCGRHQLYSQGKRFTFKEAADRYRKEYTINNAKNVHLGWWVKELGPHYLQDIRPSLITEKKQKLLTEINSKGKIRTASTCNRFLATLSHLLIENIKLHKFKEESSPYDFIHFLLNQPSNSIIDTEPLGGTVPKYIDELNLKGILEELFIDRLSTYRASLKANPAYLNDFPSIDLYALREEIKRLKKIKRAVNSFS